MNDFELITDWLGVGCAVAGWQGIENRPILILIGVTGVGKTTTTDALKAAGLTFDLLPNRRTLTDSLIIRTMQVNDDDPVELIRDRAQRFAYTRRYRALYPGGMAHALAQLKVADRQQQRLLFDGLRGENEVIVAADLLPQATFLALDAPHFVRVQRLLGRGDVFDQMTTSSSRQGDSLCALGIENVRDILSEEEEAHLWDWVAEGQVTQEELISEVGIVATERANYNPETTLAALQQHAPERTILIDTVQFNPEQIAQIVIDHLNKKDAI